MNPQSLTLVTKIALDKLRPLEVGTMVKAVYGKFESVNPVWILLLKPTSDNTNNFVLVWQKKLQPLRGNGTSETVRSFTTCYLKNI